MTRPTVVVTGAAGYVGRHVVTALADLDVRVVALSRSGPDRIDPRALVRELDVLRPGAAERIAEESPDAVIHLAWEDGFRHHSPSHMSRLSAHYLLLTGLADLGVPRIAALGTMHEVGYWEGAIAGDTPTDPRSLYGIAKDALRRSTLLAIGDRVEYLWQRCFYIDGDDRANSSIFTRILEAVDEGRTTFPFTSGRNRYDFISVQELGRQLAVSALAPGVTGIVNCCSGVPVSLGERVEAFIRDNRLPISLEYGAFPDRPYDSPGVWGDATRIRAIMAEHDTTGATT